MGVSTRVCAFACVCVLVYMRVCVCAFVRVAVPKRVSEAVVVHLPCGLEVSALRFVGVDCREWDLRVRLRHKAEAPHRYRRYRPERSAQCACVRACVRVLVFVCVRACVCAAVPAARAGR